MTPTSSALSRVFVTGATGYVGGRLVPLLLAEGHEVVCLAREPRKLDGRPWRHNPRLHIVAGDLSDVDSLARQVEGCTAAYYLVHSMEVSGRDYAERDRILAANFAQAAARAGVGRIIYLGGLGELGANLSQHLASRRQVESQLASTGVAVTTFRAAMIIGSGSASFEILRYLVERLPVMVTPRWVTTECQPVAISDVLHWLVRCLDVPTTAGRTLEIGGPDAMPYRELMQIMAEELRLPRRLIVPVPLLTPRLSSLWINLVTPVSYRIARPLAEGLRNRVVMTDFETQRLMPHRAIGVREAIRRAIQKVESNEVETRWSAAGPVPGDPKWAGGTLFKDQRSVEIAANSSAVFAAVCRIGGGNGWYAGDTLWRIRGWMDKVVGGPGLRRGRRDSEKVEFGEALDFWRVVGLDRDRSLSLRAEMKLPGEARLNFDIDNLERDRTRLTMTALFHPRGLFGILYWYGVLPFHGIVFGGMLRGIRRTAEMMCQEPSASATDPNQAVVPPVNHSRPGYGRARLWLGIASVGTMVTVATLALIWDAASMMTTSTNVPLATQLMGLLSFVLMYAAIQFPFDVVGGFVLPERYARSHLPVVPYLLSLARGIVAHSALLFFASVLLMFAGRYGGVAGIVIAGAATSVTLLYARVAIAAVLSRLDQTRSEPPADPATDRLPVVVARSCDEGFTGGVVGVFSPQLNLIPEHWRQRLSAEDLKVALTRRSLAVQSGSWRRGRWLALLFTFVGLAAAAFAVEPARLGTVAGTVELSLWFTLWSFLGLLAMPTLSRRGVAEVDARLLSEGYPREMVEKVTCALDDLQDGERDRPALVEVIFHPIPSVHARLRGPHSHELIGFWDAARTTVYLSLAGLGLLGRAVHCNCGRPALWVFLPIY